MQDQQKGFFDSMPPKTSFIFGLVASIAILSVLGVVFMFSGGLGQGSFNASNSEKVGTVAPSPSPSPTARPPAGEVPPVTDEDHIRGDKDAPLTFIEYSDYECPFCKSFHPTMLQMMEEFGDDGKIKWVYRHYPLSFHDPMATKEAEATECANELGGNDGFWAMTDLIFERTSSNGRGLDLDDLPKMAGELGLNESKFADCLDSGRYIDHVRSDLAGGSAAGVTGTPGSFLIDADGNAQLISGAVPYPQIKAMIEAVL